ncbi:DNA mismatch repair endonuclease MutL [Wukongibacter baidiensis]|uniref:DNA mismatch repair endonuclease MutL n=1 Tax=Wukongibacter baidiensis TaxID=1723361 RepID=UPI003D7FBA65
MMKRIKKLDKSVSNKIAAGEVVERPASVVKELLENSIDANATSIVIEIKDAGKSYIRVSDNGNGIYRDDINLAFERHATSKIHTDEEIYDIKSLGFRGEALASIASVSNVEVITRTVDDEYGIKVELMGGEIINESSLGCPNGTTIVIKDLFYNTPARHKFLKSNSTETNYISSIVNNIALSHPEISFRYIVNNKNIFTTQGKNDLFSTIYTIYGKDNAQNLIEIGGEEDAIKLRGFISNTTYTRGNRQLQICFVNGRYVKSRVISKSIDSAYNTLIPHNRFAICFLYIEVPSSKVDVNIHPAKTEIRFRDEKQVSNFIYKCLRDKLLKTNLIPDVNIGKANTKKVENEFKYINFDKEKELESSEQLSLSVKDKGTTFLKDYKKVEIKPIAREKYSPKEEHNRNQNENNIVDDVKKIDSNVETKEEAEIGKIFEEIFIPDKPREIVKPKIEEPIEPEEHLLDNIDIVGQLFATYIVCQKDDKMFLIDQHAAHERVLYEKFMNNYLKSEIISQILLDPIIVELNYLDKNVIIGNKNIFMRLGYKIEEFGYNTIILREVPIMFGGPVAKKFFLEIAENLNNDSKNSYEYKIERIIQMSCKKAIKAADNLYDIEIENLIEDLKALENPFTCPHGRPVIVSISKSEIERKFLRT